MKSNRGLIVKRYENFVRIVIFAAVVSPTYCQAEKKIEALWRSTWYPATIIIEKKDSCFIHYENFEESSDEWVSVKNVRSIGDSLSWGKARALKALPLSVKIPEGLPNLTLLRSVVSTPQRINDDEETPRRLIAAAERDYKNEIAAMVAHGVDINIQDVNSNSALSIASRNGYKELVKYLLGHGADKSQILALDNNPTSFNNISDDDDAQAVFIWAIFHGLRDIVEMMLKRGVDVNFSDNAGNNALAVAAGRNNGELVALLLSHGAEVTSINGIGLNPLEHALSSDGPEAALILIANGSIINNSELAWYQKQLYNCIALNDRNFGAKDPYTEKTLLMFAAVSNHPNTIRYLVRNGADVNSKFKSTKMNNSFYIGSTPLIFALREDTNLEAAKELISLKCTLDDLNNADESPLLCAVYHADLQMAAILLDAGANVNRADGFNKTPLYYAGMNGDAEMIALLKSRGGR